jgi:hypothetical protein
MLFYFLVALIIALGGIYIIHSALGPKELDTSDMPMVIFACIVYGVLWPITLPLSVIAYAAYWARLAGLKAYTKRQERAMAAAKAFNEAGKKAK